MLISMDHLIREWLYYNFAAEVFTQRNFVADFIPLKLTFIQKKRKKSLFEPLLLDLGVTYALHL